MTRPTVQYGTILVVLVGLLLPTGANTSAVMAEIATTTHVEEMAIGEMENAEMVETGTTDFAEVGGIAETVEEDLALVVRVAETGMIGIARPTDVLPLPAT